MQMAAVHLTSPYVINVVCYKGYVGKHGLLAEHLSWHCQTVSKSAEAVCFLS